mgnify:CR=1 FL=1
MHGPLSLLIVTDQTLLREGLLSLMELTGRFRAVGTSTADAKPIARLSPRETQVLTMLAAGLSVQQCADRLALSPSTVDNHKTRMMKKLDIHKTPDLVRLARSEGIVGVD